MKTRTFELMEEWAIARRGKITGTRLDNIIVKRGTGKKIGFYELIAERIAIAPDDENPMDRGTRLEAEALERFTKETGKDVLTSLVLWSRDDNDSIAVSPDGYIEDEETGAVTAAVECKCLSSARHIEAYLTNEVPDEYWMQGLQYFIVNDSLETLHFVFFDPRIPVKDYFAITISRSEVEEDIAKYKEYQEMVLREVDDVVNKLTF